MFPKRTRTELDRRVLQSLRLRETSDGNRLTVDAGGVRGAYAFEIVKMSSGNQDEKSVGSGTAGSRCDQQVAPSSPLL